MKKHSLFILLMLFSLFFAINISAQVQINGVSDSTAMLDEIFTSQVDFDYIGGVPQFELLEAPANMSINASGLISWDPENISSGGLVTVRAWNAGGSDQINFYVYVSDAIVCADQVVSYWKFDETSGSTFTDFKGGYDASTLTTLESITGMVNNAQLLNPSTNGTQFLTVTDANQYEWTAIQDFSFSFWCRPDGIPAFADTTDQVVFSRVDYSNDNMLIIGFDGAPGDLLYPKWRLMSDSLEHNQTIWEPITQGQWHHLVFVYDAQGVSGNTLMKVYVDGTLEGTANKWFSSTNSFAMNSPLAIGYFAPFAEKYPFNGGLDEVVIYNKALSLTEVGNMYADGIAHEAHCQAGNYAPLFINDFVTSVDEDELYSCTIETKDLDGDIVSISDSVLPSWLSLNPSTGVLSGIPGNNDLGDTVVVVKINDGTVTISQSFTITVSNTNDAPVISSLPELSVDEDILYSYVISYSDVDPADVLVLSATSPSWLTLNTISHTLSGTPSNSVLGTAEYVDFPVKVKVTDIAGDSAIQNFVIRVTNINDAPIILGQNNLSTPGNTEIILTVESVYSEETIVDPDNVFPDDFTLTVLPGSNYSIQVGNIVTPVDGFRGALEVYASLSDGTATVNDTIGISVDNSSPVITSTPVTSFVINGGAYVYNVTAEDADQDDELVYSADVKPAWLDFNASSHVLSGIPTADGNYDVSLSVTDGAATATQSFVITVTGGIAVDDDILSNIRFYPIPASNVLYIDYLKTNPTAEYQILNLDGKLLIQGSVNTERTEVDLSGINSGIYILRITENDQILINKIIVE